MKYIFTILMGLMLNSGAQAQTIENVFYIDFGPNDAANGNNTSGADANGNYWNNSNQPYIASSTVNLVDSANNASNISFSITADFTASNGINHGGLLAPNSDLLDDLAIATATQDYFYTTTSGAITFNGLNKTKAYVFKFFGTRESTGDRYTQYDIVGSTSKTAFLQTSGAGIGDSGYNGNNDQVVASDGIMPTGDGEITITVSVQSGGFAYLGLIKMEEVDVPGIFIDFGQVATTTASPDANGNYWNNLYDHTTAVGTVALVNKANEAGGVSVSILSDFTGSNGSGAGGLLSPSADLLGEFAIETATEDYFYATSDLNPAIKLSGLEVSKSYIFQFFATRNTTGTRKTEYSISGASTTLDTIQTSGTDIGDSGYDGNNNYLAVSAGVAPNASGEITITLSNVEGGFHYLAALKILEAETVVALPVELSLFTANLNGSVVAINWETETELNNYGFEIERLKSDDGGEDLAWQKIGFVSGFGTTNSSKSYSFTDASPAAGQNYYRLKQIDFDGKYEYSNVVEIDFTLPAEFELSQNYPNPFNPETTIEYSVPFESFVNLTVYNSLGEVVKILVNGMQSTGKYNIPFKAIDYSSGFYFAKLTSGENTKIIKMILLK
ncbi:MAG: T9SS type A sorting domain-containing protein [Melioribacteraceae bacterium]|nr:T9SS type A sorting domain-containing protein [Melioribacteraceae bacterium]MCF8432597.1 T9SS type A sorting domain-containing protein [Melioribacteraceae bacterium]